MNGRSMSDSEPCLCGRGECPECGGSLARVVRQRDIAMAVLRLIIAPNHPGGRIPRWIYDKAWAAVDAVEGGGADGD